MMVFTDNLEYKSLPPHVFALTAFCLWGLIQILDAVHKGKFFEANENADR